LRLPVPCRDGDIARDAPSAEIEESRWLTTVVKLISLPRLQPVARI